MPYWLLVTRSFSIAWRHRYLWLLALFAGEAGAGFNVGNQATGPFGPGGNTPNGSDFNSASQHVSDWFGQHISLVVAAAVLLILLVIAFFVLAAVCEGALVRASAEHDAERSFGLRIAWRCGVATMGTIIRFRLLLIALGLPVLIVFAALIAGLIVAIFNNNTAAAVAFGIFTVLVILPATLYAIYLYFLDRLGARAAVLEQLGAKAAIVRAHRLLRKRLGRVLLVWLLSIATGVVLGIGMAIVLGILVVPAVLLGVGAYATGTSLLWVAVAVVGLIVFAAALTLGGFTEAQGSTYWTLAFRRLEIEQAPVPGYVFPQAVPPSTA
jgi:hypothetical protein